LIGLPSSLLLCRLTITLPEKHTSDELLFVLRDGDTGTWFDDAGKCLAVQLRPPPKPDASAAHGAAAEQHPVPSQVSLALCKAWAELRGFEGEAWESKD
jgi:hypothetical protein